MNLLSYISCCSQTNCFPHYKIGNKFVHPTNTLLHYEIAYTFILVILLDLTSFPLSECATLGIEWWIKQLAKQHTINSKRFVLDLGDFNWLFKRTKSFRIESKSYIE